MMSRWCDQLIHDTGHADRPNGPLCGRSVVWNPCRGNHLGQRSCASAPTGRTYGRNDPIKTLQNTLRGECRPHMRAHPQAGHMGATIRSKRCKTPCEESAVHIWVWAVMALL